MLRINHVPLPGATSTTSAIGSASPPGCGANTWWIARIFRLCLCMLVRKVFGRVRNDRLLKALCVRRDFMIGSFIGHLVNLMLRLGWGRCRLRLVVTLRELTWLFVFGWARL